MFLLKWRFLTHFEQAGVDCFDVTAYKLVSEAGVFIQLQTDFNTETG